MLKHFRKTYPIYILVDLIFMGMSFYIPYLLRYNSLKDISSGIQLPYFSESAFSFVLWALFISVSLKRKGLYTTDRSLSIPKEISRTVICIFYSSILMGTIIFFAKYKFFSRQIFLISFVALCVSLSGWRVVKRLILRRMISKGYHNVNVLVVGAGRVGKIILEEVRKFPWFGFRIVGFLDDSVEGVVEDVKVLGKLSDFPVIAKKYFADEVIITIPSQRKVISGLIKQAKEMRLGLRVIPENFEEPLPLLDISHLGLVPLLTYKERRHHPAEFAFKRFCDFLISLVLLIALSPVVLVISALIKVDSKGPVLYVQRRSGFKGKTFKFYKFRSMVKEAASMKAELLDKNEVQDGVIFKMKKDPRVTRIGKILRRFSLDELPQLFNVVRGDMSLVGPRPPTPDEVEKYDHSHMERLSIRPGMTGLSQVRGRSELTFKKWVRLDRWYINNWSLGFDFRILWWTIFAVFKGKGAY